MVKGKKIKQTFGNRFSDILLDGNITQGEVARRLKTSPSLVSRWKNDEITPGLESAKNIARMFGVDLNWLLTGHKKKDSVTTLGNQTYYHGDAYMNEVMKQLDFIFENGSESDVEFLCGKIGRIFLETTKKVAPVQKKK